MVRKLQLLTDAALGEGNAEELDGLEFSAYASVLANAATNTAGPFTIGVFGEWGTGKTSLMRMTQRQLESEKKVVTVWFNAWRYEQEQHPIVPLIATIVRGIERKEDFLTRLGSVGTTLVRSLRAAAYGFSGKSKLKLPGFAEVEATFVAKDMIERDKELTPDPLLDKSLYYEAFETLSSIKLDPSTKIVVFIDDLDRCFPNKAINLLESVKLVLAQPGFVFILGVARDILEGYLQHRYAVEYGISDFEGRSYLDKMVQLPFHIPPHKERMDSFTSKILDRLSTHVRSDFSDLLPIIGFASGHNPRATIRYVNNLLVDLAINESLSDARAMEKIPLRFFAISRCLQFRWPAALKILQDSDMLAKRMSAWTKDSLNSISSDLSDPVEAQLAGLLKGDSELFDLLQTPEGQSWLKGSKHRKACIQFLRNQKRDFQPEFQEIRNEVPVLVIPVGIVDGGPVMEVVNFLASSGIECVLTSDNNESLDKELVRRLRSKTGPPRTVLFVVGANTDKSPIWKGDFLGFIKKGLIDPVLLLVEGSSISHIPRWLQVANTVDARGGLTLKVLIQLRSSFSF